MKNFYPLPPPIKVDALPPWGTPHPTPSPLKNKAPLLKSKVSFQEVIPGKKKKIIGIWDEYWCFTHKTSWTKMTKIPQERNFLTSNIQNFVSKVNEFVCKYCIT